MKNWIFYVMEASDEEFDTEEAARWNMGSM